MPMASASEACQSQISDTPAPGLDFLYPASSYARLCTTAHETPIKGNGRARSRRMRGSMRRSIAQSGPRARGLIHSRTRFVASARIGGDSVEERPDQQRGEGLALQRIGLFIV